MTSSIQRIVLVVDDDADCLATLELALGTMPGVAVRGVASAEEALAVLDGDTMSAVITDVQLPGLSGLDLLTRMRENAKWRAMPVVVISADADPATPDAALRVGADAYFPKPFSPAAVRRKLEELMYAKS